MFLVNNWCGRVHLTQGSSTPGQAILGGKRNRQSKSQEASQQTALLYDLHFSSCLQVAALSSLYDGL